MAEKKFFKIEVSSTDALITTASKGDQSKWGVGSKWIKADTQGYEGLAEEFSSLFLSCIDDIDYVPYFSCRILKNNGEELVGCYSESMFKNKEESFITFHKLYEQHGIIYEDTLKYKSTEDKIVSTIDFIKKNFNVDITYYLLNILYIDKIILNEDRHPSNLGLIKNIKTNEYRLAPIFDNGLGFLARNNEWGKVPIHVAERNIKFEPFGNKQVGVLSKLYDNKLVIDKDLLDEKIRNYTNSLYGMDIVEKVKKLLVKNLLSQEGYLWIRK